MEMYSRLNTGPVYKSNAGARAEYLLRKRREDAAALVHAEQRCILVPEQICHGLLGEPHPPPVKHQAIVVFLFWIAHKRLV